MILLKRLLILSDYRDGLGRWESSIQRRCHPKPQLLLWL